MDSNYLTNFDGKDYYRLFACWRRLVNRNHKYFGREFAGRFQSPYSDIVQITQDAYECIGIDKSE